VTTTHAAVAPDAFKDALRRWPSGVTVVTARAGERIHGMTVSAFSSVSLDPPLVLICADKASETHHVIADGGVFAVNVLAVGQESLSNRFASKKDEVVAAIDCRVVAAHDAGDHVIYVGRVEGVETRDVEPLVFHAGLYRGLGS
jgi:flavin reductase (DIM6/NTAB) family NADH-FMN oxidoreductase RutF